MDRILSMQWPTRLVRSSRYDQINKSKIRRNTNSQKWGLGDDKKVGCGRGHGRGRWKIHGRNKCSVFGISGRDGGGCGEDLDHSYNNWNSVDTQDIFWDFISAYCYALLRDNWAYVSCQLICAKGLCNARQKWYMQGTWQWWSTADLRNWKLSVIL